jgi:methenyltetrahydromethanopterin cyclohydrolase
VLDDGIEMQSSLRLNERAWQRAEQLIARADELRLTVSTLDCGTRVVDCGAKALGGLEAGRLLAEICMSGLGSVQIARGREKLWAGASVSVVTDQPILACMASQYAGWHVTGEKYFAMGSGPMRAAAHREPLLHEIVERESTNRAVGVLEASKLPPDEVCRSIAADCGVPPASLLLLVARTKSLAGNVQVVARSVETALHKLHAVGFDLKRVVSGFGTAPLPPPAVDDLGAIGRTNDSMLYGGEVTLWITGDDASVAEIGPKVPSNSSSAFGQPFAQIFEAAGRDFYQIDASLFSPAAVTFSNVETGRTQRFGEVRPDIVAASFGG